MVLPRKKYRQKHLTHWVKRLSNQQEIQKSIIILFASKIRTILLVQFSRSRWISEMRLLLYLLFYELYAAYMGKPKVPIYFEDGCLVLVWTLNWGPQDLWDRSSWKTGWRKTQACTCSGIGETITIRTNDVGQIQIQNFWRTLEVNFGK